MAVTRVVMTSRQPLANGQAFGAVGPYEQLDGTVYFAVDPDHPTHQLIADLQLAPRDRNGCVHFSSDFRIAQPTDATRGNGRLLFDVVNRGRALALRNLNSAPDVAAHQPAHPGNGFLMRHGYTLAWCGWQHDAPDVPGVLRLHTPEAVTPEGPVSGKIAITFQPTVPAAEQFLSNRFHRAHPATDLTDPDAVLTEQEHEDAPERMIPRDQWSFSRLEADQVIPDASHVYYPAGFKPGCVYQVIYTTTGAPIVGLGLVATRDMAAFLRYGSTAAGNPCTDDIKHVYGFGVSQSGRFLRSFLYYGLNQDDRDRTVFDGIMPHVAGAKHGEFNQRFAQPSSQASRSPNSQYPFSDLEQTDPETGVTDGILSRTQSLAPKIVYTYTSSEYWAGHGALVHVDLTGTKDLEVPEGVRIYHFGGTQHGLGPNELSHRDAAHEYHGGHPLNWADYRPLMRAALVNLDHWVTTGEAAPPSQHPRLDDGTAVTPESLRATFCALPGTQLPEPLRCFTRLDFGLDNGVATHVPPKVGKPYPCLVSAVDADGNEVSGIRLPFHTVPLATYTGWNRRHADIGGENQVLASGGASGGTLIGSTIPFAATREARARSGDPRLSIEERYASKAAYLEQIEQATQALIKQRYVLAEDLDSILQQAAQHYDRLRG